jgi:CRISPR/Cas system-associated protein Cas5 (RAMP superfamily)
MRISENRKLFDISDRQLVHVSGLVDQLVERIDDLESSLKEVKDELAEMERIKRMGWSS